MSTNETHSPAYMRALAEIGDDKAGKARLALAEVLWREAGGDVPAMLVLLAEVAALLSASFGPETAAVFREAFEDAVPIAKRTSAPQ